MKPRVSMPSLLLLLAAMFVAGCGGSETVTYVDPNGSDGAVSGDGLDGTPFLRHGSAVVERQLAIVRLRATLTAAATLVSTDREAAAGVVAHALDDSFPFIEPRLHAADAASARQLRTALEGLADSRPRQEFAFAREIRRVADVLVRRAEELVVPAAARQDVRFRAAITCEMLEAAGLGYEQAFEDPDEQPTIDYQLAYGLVTDILTRHLEAVPEDARELVRGRLEETARRSFPGPTPPDDPRPSEDVLGELTSVAGEVGSAARVDVSRAEPERSTPDDLRTLKRRVATAVEAWERGDLPTAARQLRDADRAELADASSGIAAVSPVLLAELERDLLITLPDAMRGSQDVTTLAADVDGRIDEAISLVEEELQLLRDAG